MKVTQEKLPDSQIGLEIEIPAETAKETYEKVVQDLTRSTNIPGFRKGKVPRQILLQHIGIERVKAAVLEELIQKSLQQAVEREAIATLGNYKLQSNFEELVQQYRPGEPLTFSAAVDVPPEVKLGDYQSLSVKTEETPYDPSEVDQLLEERRVAKATLIPVEDRPAQGGDIAAIDYQGCWPDDGGKIGEPISGVQGTDFQVELVEGKFIEGFVDGIVGMKPEETKEIPLTFPEDYQREDLAGKPVIFTITLKELKAKELPELDDDFAQEVSEFETMAELRESLETQLKEKAAKETNNSIQGAILEELVKQSSIDLPESMIQEEVNAILTQTAMQMQQNYGVDVKKLFTPETIPQMRERSRPEAIERIKHSLILAEIAKRESIAPEGEAIEARIQELTEKLSDRDVDRERLRQMVEEDLKVEKTLNWLQEKATVELVAKGSLAESEEEEEGPVVSEKAGEEEPESNVTN